MKSKCLYTVQVICALILSFIFAAILITTAIFFALGLKPYTVSSGSMAPAIPKGSIAVVNTKDTSVNEGDVIAYTLPNTTVVLHRVEAITESGYYTKGDANISTDPSPIQKDQIVGQYAFHIPYIGNIYLSVPLKILSVVVLVLMTVPFFIETKTKTGGMYE